MRTIFGKQRVDVSSLLNKSLTPDESRRYLVAHEQAVSTLEKHGCSDKTLADLKKMDSSLSIVLLDVINTLSQENLLTDEVIQNILSVFSSIKAATRSSDLSKQWRISDLLQLLSKEKGRLNTYLPTVIDNLSDEQFIRALHTLTRATSMNMQDIFEFALKRPKYSDDVLKSIDRVYQMTLSSKLPSHCLQLILNFPAYALDITKVLKASRARPQFYKALPENHPTFQLLLASVNDSLVNLERPATETELNAFLQDLEARQHPYASYLLAKILAEGWCELEVDNTLAKEHLLHIPKSSAWSASANKMLLHIARVEDDGSAASLSERIKYANNAGEDGQRYLECMMLSKDRERVIAQRSEDPLIQNLYDKSFPLQTSRNSQSFFVSQNEEPDAASETNGKQLSL